MYGTVQMHVTYICRVSQKEIGKFYFYNNFGHGSGHHAKLLPSAITRYITR